MENKSHSSLQIILLEVNETNYKHTERSLRIFELPNKVSDQEKEA